MSGMQEQPLQECPYDDEYYEEIPDEPWNEAIQTEAHFQEPHEAGVHYEEERALIMQMELDRGTPHHAAWKSESDGLMHEPSGDSGTAEVDMTCSTPELPRRKRRRTSPLPLTPGLRRATMMRAQEQHLHECPYDEIGYEEIPDEPWNEALKTSEAVTHYEEEWAILDQMQSDVMTTDDAVRDFYEQWEIDSDGHMHERSPSPIHLPEEYMPTPNDFADVGERTTHCPSTSLTDTPCPSDTDQGHPEADTTVMCMMSPCTPVAIDSTPCPED